MAPLTLAIVELLATRLQPDDDAVLTAERDILERQMLGDLVRDPHLLLPRREVDAQREVLLAHYGLLRVGDGDEIGEIRAPQTVVVAHGDKVDFGDDAQPRRLVLAGRFDRDQLDAKTD